MTESEIRFEQFCVRRDIHFRRIPESLAKTPDYEVVVGGLKAVVEVKQIEPNAGDHEVIDQLSRHRIASQWVDMSRARQSILDAAKQLKAYVTSEPALVVLYERFSLLGHLDRDCIAQCLHGPLQAHVGIPEDPAEQPVLLGNSRGGRRATTDRHNTTVSAVAVLRGVDPDLSLFVYHNAFAARPIAPSALRLLGVHHFTWRSPDVDRLPEWVDVTEGAA